MVAGEVVVVDSQEAVLGEQGEEGESNLHHPQQGLCRCFGQLYHEKRGKETKQSTSHFVQTNNLCKIFLSSDFHFAIFSNPHFSHVTNSQSFP
jgi:hypothetical protein